MDSDSALEKMATDEELVRLGKSEHPLLRAASFREMLKRKSFNHFDILMEHLDDTALVPTDAGEFGIWYRTVSDDILQKAGWKTQETKNRTVEQVLTKHNYLQSAYFILLQIEPQEKYYPFIKNMATCSRRLDRWEGYELGFDDIEYALYRLAKFKKKEDVQVIKKQLMKYVGRLGHLSFQLMKEYPDTAYLKIFQAYHRRRFYKFSRNRRNGFTGFSSERADPEVFIQALAAQKNDWSAWLLDTILSNLPLLTDMPDKENIEDNVVMAIWENPSAAYVRLREKIKTKAEKILKRRFSVEIERHEEPIDATLENIRWYP